MTHDMRSSSVLVAIVLAGCALASGPRASTFDAMAAAEGGRGKGPKLLLTNDNTRPIWVPVSQERYIRSKITGWQKQIARTKPPYDQTGRRDVAALEAELAGLSAAARVAASYISNEHSSRPSGLGSANERGARAIVATNTAFFDRARPKTSFQMAAVETYPQELLMRTPNFYMGRVVVEAMKTVDWKQIAGLLQ